VKSFTPAPQIACLQNFFLVLQPQLARVGFAMMEDAARGATMVQTTRAWARELERLHGRIALASDVPNRGDDRWIT
jgi:hypothetical protein